MDIHDKFEAVYADQYDAKPEEIKSCRMSNGSYNNLRIARAFRMFYEGYHANKQEPMKLLGYLSKNGLSSAEHSAAASFKSEQSDIYYIPVYIRGRQK